MFHWLVQIHTKRQQQGKQTRHGFSLTLCSGVLFSLLGCASTTNIGASPYLFNVSRPAINCPKIISISESEQNLGAYSVSPTLNQSSMASMTTGDLNQNIHPSSPTDNGMSQTLDHFETPDFGSSFWSQGVPTPPPLTLSEKLLFDQQFMYSNPSLEGLGVGFLMGGVFANTNFDQQIHKHFQSSVRGATSDEWFEFLHANKELGNGIYTLPIFGGLWLANEYVDGPPAFEMAGKWGERSFRGFMVGALPVVVMQQVTGGSRPYESSDGSTWHPFRDNNGVSGHAFMSSLPFITAAKMTDSPWQKGLWYAGSTIGPLSRVNDGAHYPSQIGLGWLIAYAAASAVNQTETGRDGWTIVPIENPQGTGFAMQYRW